MDVLYAISEPSRRKIVQLLAKEGSLTTSEIGTRFHSSAPAISQHLKTLLEAKAVSVTKIGRKRIYSLNPEALLELEQWARSLAIQWQQKFNKLDQLLANEQNKILKNYHSQLKKGKRNGTKRSGI